MERGRGGGYRSCIGLGEEEKGIEYTHNNEI